MGEYGAFLLEACWDESCEVFDSAYDVSTEDSSWYISSGWVIRMEMKDSDLIFGLL